MSSMSSAQIVSATAMHSKSAGLSLGLTPPVSYTGAVSWSFATQSRPPYPSLKKTKTSLRIDAFYLWF